MRVRYLKGNQAGLVDELPDVDAKAAIADGFAEAYVPPVVTAAPAPKATKPPAPARARPRRKPAR